MQSLVFLPSFLFKKLSRKTCGESAGLPFPLGKERVKTPEASFKVLDFLFLKMLYIWFTKNPSLYTDS